MRPRGVYPAIALAILCMSTASIMIRWCSAPPLIVAMYRVIFTAIIAVPLVRGSFIAGVKNISGRDLIYIAGAGFFLALHFAFWITSLDYTSVSSSVLFTNLQVIFVLLFSFLLLQEKINIKALGGIFLALVGSSLVAGGDWHQGRLLGDLLALLSGIFVAVYILAGRRVRARVEAMSYTALVSGAAGFTLLLAALISGQDFFSYPARDWLLFVLLALGPGIAGHGIIIWALKYIKAPVVAVSILGESVGASILAFFIFGESLLWYQLAGGCLILSGIYTAAVNERSDCA
jgi:drug/metabolite transporter (DMT)-like permease